MARALLLSDVHLAPDLPRCTEGLKALLRELPADCEAVYVLGDLFEVWVGDDHHSPYIDSICECFRSLGARGISLAFCHGNRDFLLGEDFARQAGGRLMAEAEVVELCGIPALLMHGDQLCTLDEAYMAFRAQSRNPAWQQGMLTQPLEQRLMIAEMWRMKSKMANSNKPENIMDVTATEVVRVMAEAGVELLIHGHTHRPMRHAVELPGDMSGERLVLGDWREDSGEAVIAWATPEGVQLQTWRF